MNIRKKLVKRYLGLCKYYYRPPKNKRVILKIRAEKVRVYPFILSSISLILLHGTFSGEPFRRTAHLK
jgi:hypothetical protein